MKSSNEDVCKTINLLCDDIKSKTKELVGDISQTQNLKIIIELSVGETPTIKVEKRCYSEAWLKDKWRKG